MVTVLCTLSSTRAPPMSCCFGGGNGLECQTKRESCCLCKRESVCVYEGECVSVCVRERGRVCVCVCGWILFRAYTFAWVVGSCVRCCHSSVLEVSGPSKGNGKKNSRLRNFKAIQIPRNLTSCLQKDLTMANPFLHSGVAREVMVSRVPFRVVSSNASPMSHDCVCS